MASTTSLVIPIADSHSAESICQRLNNPFIFTAYTEEKMKRVVETTAWLVFKRKIETTHTVAKGTRIEVVGELLASVMSGKSDYQLLGHLNDAVYADLIDGLKTAGDVCDWQPWDFSVQTGYSGSWGEDLFSYQGLCAVVSGYGNPTGPGSPYAKAVLSTTVLGKIADSLGRHVALAQDSECTITVDGKTVFADLDC